MANNALVALFLLGVAAMASASTEVGLGAGLGAGVGGVGDNLGVGAGPALAGYVPEASPFSTPDSALQVLTPTIPSAPDCSIRPQTIVEIQRMRETATSIAQSVQREVVIMNRRKAYIEQMTAYLNDRIRELNKVKSELAEEVRWITVSQNRIQELAEREKLVKYQDVLACLNTEQEEEKGETTYRTNNVASLQKENMDVIKKIQDIQKTISLTTKGVGEDGVPLVNNYPAGTTTTSP